MSEKEHRALKLQKTPAGVQPFSQFDDDLLRQISIGGILDAYEASRRSGRQHRLYWGLVRLVFQNQDRYRTIEQLHNILKFRLGLVESVEFNDGRTLLIPSSIAYDKMTGIEFGKFLDAVINIISTDIIPNLDNDGQKGLMEEIENYTSGELRQSRSQYD